MLLLLLLLKLVVGVVVVVWVAQGLLRDIGADRE